VLARAATMRAVSVAEAPEDVAETLAFWVTQGSWWRRVLAWWRHGAWRWKVA